MPQYIVALDCIVKSMEIIIHILMLFIFITSVIKISFWKPKEVFIFSMICTLFILLTYNYATLQSKTQISDFLQDTKKMQNMAVLVTIESLIMFTFAFSALKKFFGEKVNKWIFPVLKCFPSLLVFGVLFYSLTQAIFVFSGISFALIAYVFAGMIFIAFPLLSYLIKLLIPEEELRYEMHFFVSLIVSILGLLATVNGEVTYRAVEQQLNTNMLLIAFSVFAILFLGGYSWNKLKWRIKNK